MPKLTPEIAQQVRESQKIILQSFLFLEQRVQEVRFDGTKTPGLFAIQMHGLAKFCSGEYSRWAKIIQSNEAKEEIQHVQQRLTDLHVRLRDFAENRPDDELLGLLRVWIERAEALVEPMLPVRITTPDTAKTNEIGDTLRSLRPSLPPQATTLTYSGANIESRQAVEK